MENYQEKARENFYRNRPYGIHIDYARKGFVLFNHYTNCLGKQETGSIEGLPLEKFEDVDAIPLNGKINKRHYKIFCVNGNTGFRNESRIFYFIHLQNEEDYERKESSSA